MGRGDGERDMGQGTRDGDRGRGTRTDEARDKGRGSGRMAAVVAVE